MMHLRFLLLLLIFVSPLAAEKPNILFIAIDDLNDWVSPLGGHPQVQTPNMERLAQRGTTFLNAHCQAPLCNPSRTSLMTGLRPSSTGIYGLAPWFRDVDEFKYVVTLPQYLETQGYTTYSTGKIFHGGYGRKPDDKEFKVLGPAASVGARPKEKLVTTPFGNHGLVDWGVFPHEDEDKGDWKVASWAEETLDAKPKGPWFLSVGFFLPHVPNYATQKWFDLYPEESIQLPPWLPGDRNDTSRSSWYTHWYLPEPRLKFLREADQWRNVTRSYLACISFVDSQVGRVIDALERNGFAENTIIVLWSDHGYHLGEKDITGKNTLWNRSTHVPLIFAGPGVGIDKKTNRPAELLDIYPTLLELTNSPPNPNLEGHSLVPQLNDPDAKREWPAITTHNQGNHSIRNEEWRYIVYRDGEEELYDPKNDPNEWFNLAKDRKYQGVLKRMRKWLPEEDRLPAPGSAARVLVYDKDTIIWEDKVIQPNDPIPGL
jgi:choline-sulfatase